MNGKNKKADYIFGKKNVLPFIAKDGSSNIIDEMNKHLAILFEDSQNKNTYQTRLKMAETPRDALKSEIREELYCQRETGIERT